MSHDIGLITSRRRWNLPSLADAISAAGWRADLSNGVSLYVQHPRMSSITIVENTHASHEYTEEEYRRLEDVMPDPLMLRANYLGYDVEALIELLHLLTPLGFLAEDAYGNLHELPQMIELLEDRHGRGVV